MYFLNTFFWCFSPGEHISVSGPEGPFSVRPLRDVSHLFLLAAGTGFTPMARLIQLAQDSETIRWETHSTKILLKMSPFDYLNYINHIQI